jgi:hypothetical protein
MLKTIIQPVTGRTFKFGRIISTMRSRPALLLGDVINLSTLPTPPSSYNWSTGPALNPDGLENVLDNDKYGCCTCSGAAHVIDQALAASGNPYSPITPAQVLWAYSQVTNPPFDPGAPLDVDGNNPTDTGADETVVLDWWRDHGFLEDGSHKILGWGNVDATNWPLVSSCCWLFENLYLGMALPDAWINPIPSVSGFIWDVAGEPDPANGHCVEAFGYDADGVLIDTWGMFGKIPPASLAKYCSGATGELHVVLTEDSINAASLKAPTGFDRDQLEFYLKAAV